jgi:hypothetical protein
MWTTRTLIARHKAAAGVAVVLLVLLLVIVVGGVLTSRQLVVRDSTSCSAWSSASQTGQRAYATRYVGAHGALHNGATDPASVIAAINNGCMQAFVNDSQDSVTVVEAIQQ